jgi:fimbrial chaperone protein
MSKSVIRAARRAAWLLAPTVLTFSGIFAATALAGSFQVNPIRVDLGKGATNAVIKVRNDGDEAVVIQASVLAWTQTNGQDAYTPTMEALITPPVMTVAPGAEQVVRVGLRRGPDPQRELAYRVFLQEVAPPPKPGFSGLQVALRVGLPVFVAPVAPATRQLEWSARVAANGTVMLTAKNTGNAHVQVTDVGLSAPGGEPVAHESSLAYVLAGQTHEWTLPASPDRAKPSGELRLKAITDAGDIDTAVKVAP